VLPGGSAPAPRHPLAGVRPSPDRSDSPRRRRPAQVLRRAYERARHSTRLGSPRGFHYHARNATRTPGQSARKGTTKIWVQMHDPARDLPLARLDMPVPGQTPLHGVLRKILSELLTNRGLGIRRAKLTIGEVDERSNFRDGR
jgi:hypothetical protein